MAIRQQQATYQRWQLAVSGTVQGVGFRPFVYQLAQRCGLGGWVRNTGDGVLIEVEGPAEMLEQFLLALRNEMPPLAHIREVIATEIEPYGESAFAILHSQGRGEARTTIPPDVATCDACLAETMTPGERRYHYPFTNCTHCGPRFTITEAIPYDRPNTTMRDFPLCPECQAEYEDPGDRRFHAQPVACPVCGPHLSLDGKSGDDAAIITETAHLLHEGKILAVKGLGGYHLACDARNQTAVETLRARKGRGGKPFAVMCADLDEVRRICQVDAAAERLLTARERPIVLLPARECNGIAPAVAAGTVTLGLMLPYTPLHYILLAEAPPTLVMTSGNLSEEPLVYRDDEARARLGHIADHILSHNRPIAVPCDDSVVRPHDDTVMVIRRARGYVPVPIELAEEKPAVLACGGDLKNAFCLTKGKLALLSQHLGDLENVPSQQHHRQQVEHFCRFFDVTPTVVAHDLHPDYHSTRFAQAYDVPRIGIQHHHAHIAACLAEHHFDGPVIGVAFDGTGYGTDGAIWGGEFLIADYTDFRRAAQLAYVPLPGAEAAIKRPGRMALSYLLQAFGAGTNPALVPDLSAAEVEVVTAQVLRGLNAPLTSSMGRLFDAVSALLGVCATVTYEGQAAIELEHIADPAANIAYSLDLPASGSETLALDMRPLFRQIAGDLQAGVSRAVIAGRFHATIAELAVMVCERLRAETVLNTVALSGGVFQNLLLLNQTTARLHSRGFQVLAHQLVPPNDGGLALGQAVIAARRIQQECV